jgi:hypothetical protein
LTCGAIHCQHAPCYHHDGLSLPLVVLFLPT